MKDESTLYEKIFHTDAVANYNYEMKSRITKLYDYMLEDIPGDLIPPAVTDQEVEEKLKALEVKYMVVVENPENVETDDSVLCECLTENAFDNRKICLYPGKKLPGAERAEQDVLGVGINKTFCTELCGKKIELAVLKISRLEDVVITDDLVKKEGIEGVETIAAYRNWCRHMLELDKKNKAAQNVIGFFFKRILDKSEFEIDQQEKKNWTYDRAKMFLELDSANNRNGNEIIKDSDLMQAELVQRAKEMEGSFNEYLAYVAISQGAGVKYGPEEAAKVIEDSAKAAKMDFEDAMRHVNMRHLLEIVYMNSTKDILIQNALKKLQDVED
jgi:uncharacterized protein (DUF2344 family)